YLKLHFAPGECAQIDWGVFGTVAVGNTLRRLYEARSENRQAADCYRKAIEIIRAQPESYDPEFADVFVKFVDKLEPPTASQNTRSLRLQSVRAKHALALSILLNILGLGRQNP